MLAWSLSKSVPSYSLEVIAELAEAADESDDEDVDVSELDESDGEESAGPGEGKVDGLQVGEVGLVEAELGLEEDVADVGVAGVGDGVGAKDNQEEDVDGAPVAVSLSRDT